MPRHEETVYLHVNGSIFSGWQEVSITSGLEIAARGFQLKITSKYPGQTNFLGIKVDDYCELKIGDDDVLTGWVEKAAPHASRNQNDISIGGRSLTSTAIKCSVLVRPLQWINQTGLQIVRSVADSYALVVVADSDIFDTKIRHFSCPAHTKVMELITAIGRQHGWLITDTAAGEIRITKAGSERAEDLIWSQNIKEGGSDNDSTNRYQKYNVLSQTAGDDANFGDLVATCKGEATDDQIGRRLPDGTIVQQVLTLHAEKQANHALCKKRAEYEAAARAGRSVKVPLIVQGWRQSNGQLWRPNLLSRVRAPEIQVDNVDLLITECEYICNRKQGIITRMDLGPAAGYLPEPLNLAMLKKMGMWTAPTKPGGVDIFR